MAYGGFTRQAQRTAPVEGVPRERVDVEPKKWEDSKVFHELKIVTTKKGKEYIVSRSGVETWKPVAYYEAAVRNHEAKQLGKRIVREQDHSPYA